MAVQVQFQIGQLMQIGAVLHLWSQGNRSSDCRKHAVTLTGESWMQTLATHNDLSGICQAIGNTLPSFFDEGPERITETQRTTLPTAIVLHTVSLQPSVPQVAAQKANARQQKRNLTNKPPTLALD